MTGPPPQPTPSELVPAVYDRLRRIAAGYLQRLQPGQTVQPTDVVHEAYMRLEASERATWRSKTQYVAVAARAIRNLLIDRVRARAADKRGGNWRRVTLSTQTPGGSAVDVDLLALHEALESLAERDPRQARIVELRFFGGLGNEEIAEVVDVSSRTVSRELRMAQAWLLRELERGGTA